MTVPFPCLNSTAVGIGRSLVRPKSVHKLRPGDIDVVGAMGDSLVAGNGAMEEWALGTMIEYRGISWCAGKILFTTKNSASSPSNREGVTLVV